MADVRLRSQDSTKPRSRSQRAGSAGFTLIEVLVVVAIIGLLASIAIPSLQDALLKAKTNKAISSLKTFRDAMTRFAADNGNFPERSAFNLSTLNVLQPAYLKGAQPVLTNFAGSAFDAYVPWNTIAVPRPPSLDNPQSFLVMATLEFRPEIRLIVTDGDIYTYINGKITRVGMD